MPKSASWVHAEEVRHLHVLGPALKRCSYLLGDGFGGDNRMGFETRQRIVLLLDVLAPCCDGVNVVVGQAAWLAVVWVNRQSAMAGLIY
jgi:hypothetical protein